MIPLLNEQLQQLINNVNEIAKLPNSEKIVERCNIIINKIQLIIQNSEHIKADSGTVRYKDFFVNNETAKNNVKSVFEYSGEIDCTNNFIIYCIIECLKEINLITRVNEWPIDEINELLNFCEEYENLNDYMDYLFKYFAYIKKQNELTLPFLNNKYKIHFAGHAIDDILSLPKHVIIQLIKKIAIPLSTDTVISLAEGIDHVNEKYDTSFFRIQLANDYRITYERYGNYTIILGVTLKNGKNTDYTRYDSIAVKNSQILMECDDNLSYPDDDKILAFLQERYLIYLRETHPENESYYYLKPFSYFDSDDDGFQKNKSSSSFNK